MQILHSKLIGYIQPTSNECSMMADSFRHNSENIWVANNDIAMVRYYNTLTLLMLAGF